MRFFVIAFSVILLDQVSKLIIRNISLPISILPGFLDITLIMNTGAGFGMLQGKRWLLVWISVVVIGLILYYLDRIPKDEKFAFALILGGAAGNLIDRLFIGAVTDFVNFSFWPAFNLADSAVTVGAALLIILSLKNKEKN